MLRRTPNGLSIALLLSCLSGCTQPASLPSIPERRQATIAIDVIDDIESSVLGVTLGRAELYLKVESSLHPGKAILIPVNIGDFAGSQRRTQVLPFFLNSNDSETFRFELLDDDELTSAEEAALLDAAAAGGVLLWVGGCVYAHQPRAALIPEGQALSAELARNLGNCVLTGLESHKFESIGVADWHVPPDPPHIYRSANPVTIRQATRARVEVRVYYPKRAG